MPRHASTLPPLPPDFVGHSARKPILNRLSLLPVPFGLSRGWGRRVCLDDEMDLLMFRQPKGIERLQHSILENSIYGHGHEVTCSAHPATKQAPPMHTPALCQDLFLWGRELLEFML